MPAQPTSLELPTRVTWYVLYALSGAAALVYQVVWQRQLSLALGVSAHATAITLAAFMGGLALGSAWGGRLAERTRPARLYAGAELALAALALAGSFAFEQLPRIVAAFSSGSDALRILLSACVLLPPACLMGITYPAMVAAFAAGGRGVGASSGALAAANTLGAAAGTLGAAFVLIERFGLRGTTRIAVAVNVAVGLFALALTRTRASADRIEEKPPLVERFDARARGAALAVAAVGGFTTLANEGLWTRALLYALGDNSAFAFAEMLAAVLLGLVVGGAFIVPLADRVRRPLLLLGVLQLALAVSTVAGTAWLHAAGVDRIVSGGIVRGEGVLYTQEALAPFAWRALFESVRITALPALLAGASLPLAIRILAAGSGAPGRETGRALAANTLAAVAGALVSGFVLLPAVGFRTALAITASLNVLAGAAALLAEPRAARLTRAGLVGAGALAVALLGGLAASTEAPWRLALTHGQPGFEVLYYKDGVSASIGVVRKTATDDRVLWVDGDAQAGTDLGMRLHLELLGHLGPSLHPHPRLGLVVGLGAGVTLGAMSEHPFERIDVAELSREVREAVPLFEKANRRAFEDPRVRITFEDGRNFLLASPGGYDVITSDPIDPDDAGVTSLYSQEYYRLVRERLAPGGIACHWIPTQYSTEVYASLVEAFRSVFPESWLFDADFTTVIVGRREDGPAIGYAALEAALAAPRVRASLGEFGIDGAPDLLALRLAGPRGLERLTAGRPPNSDDRPIAEYEGPRSLRARSPESFLDKSQRLNAVRDLDPDGPVTEIPAAARPALESAFTAAGRAFRARLVIPLKAKDREPAARARLLALRLPAPRFVDILCGFEKPEFPPGPLPEELVRTFDAGLDALERNDAASAAAAFERMLAMRAGSPRALLGELIAAIDLRDPIRSCDAAVELARREPYLRSLAVGILKLRIDRLLAASGEAPARRALELVPSLASVDRAHRLERWRAGHRALRFDPARGSFEPGLPAERDAGEDAGR